MGSTLKLLMAVHTQCFGPPEPPGLKELFYFIRKGSLKIATRSFINLTFLCPPKTYPSGHLPERWSAQTWWRNKQSFLLCCLSPCGPGCVRVPPFRMWAVPIPQPSNFALRGHPEGSLEGSQWSGSAKCPVGCPCFRLCSGIWRAVRTTSTLMASPV